MNPLSAAVSSVTVGDRPLRVLITAEADQGPVGSNEIAREKALLPFGLRHRKYQGERGRRAFYGF